MYTYRAQVIKKYECKYSLVHQILFDVDLGFGHWEPMKLVLLGMDWGSYQNRDWMVIKVFSRTEIRKGVKLYPDIKYNAACKEYLGRKD